MVDLHFSYTFLNVNLALECFGKFANLNVNFIQKIILVIYLVLR